MGNVSPLDFLNGALRKLGARGDSNQTSQSESPARIRMAGDPTIGMFGDDEAPSKNLSESLSARLEQSSRDIADARAMLREHARDIQSASAAREQGERRILVYGFRLLIGLAWILTALWLQQSALGARAGGADLTSFGMPTAHATAISELFFLIGAIASVAAAFIIVLVFLSGNGSNSNLCARGKFFGERLAIASSRFNDTLQFFQEKIADTKRSPAQVVPAVSQAHLTALEAKLFFEDVRFLTTADDDRAEGYFRDFMRRFSGVRGSAGGALDLILVLSIGFLGGLFVGYIQFRTGAPAAAPINTAATAPELMRYPGVIAALLGGSALYLFSGLAASMLGGLFDNATLTSARREALDSVRSAYLAQGAPVAADVVRQVDNVVHILQSRLTSAGGGDYAGFGAASDQSAAGPDAPWRNRDSSVQFIETSFASAPDGWRTDAFAKKMDAKGTGEPGSKRGFPKIKKGSPS